MILNIKSVENIFVFHKGIGVRANENAACDNKGGRARKDNV